MRGIQTVAVMTIAGAVALGGALAVRAQSAHGVTLTPFLHASLQIEGAGLVIQVDPWTAADTARAKPADAVLVTDDSGHHLDLAAIARVRKPGAPVILPPVAKGRLATGTVLANGAAMKIGAAVVESVAAYDLTPGEPSHPKGDASGYLVTIGGERILIAGVTECVPELRALRNIDVAVMPMNIPPGRMSPAAAADCVKALKPRTVYVYHYDQGQAATIEKRQPSAGWLAPGATVPDTLQAFKAALAGTAIDVRLPDWYATRP
jgi:L-ascorbate metabolism protein UlaG (beta-lactamase superfamily)